VDLTARKLILDLLTTVRRGAMPVRALVEAGELFGFAANNVRVSLSKLTSEGRVDRDERGRYRLARTTAVLAQRLRGWRRLEEQRRAWRGGFIAVHRSRRGRGAVRARSDRALELLGFRELERGLHVRPDNLVGGVAGARERYAALAAGGGAAAASEPQDGTLVYGMLDLDPATRARAEGLWVPDVLFAGYRHWVERLAASRDRLPSLSPEAAMVETFLVGGGAVRHLQFDPLLPVELLDPKPRQDLIEAMRSYDELGRLQWAPFLNRHEVPSFRARDGWRARVGEIPDATLEGMRIEC